MSAAYQQPDPRDSTDEWLPPADADVVNETHRFEAATDGTHYLTMFDATCEFGGTAWIETNAFVSLELAR